MSENTTYDVIVIGGGASGMIAAAEAARLGAKVLLLEKNHRLGEKLRISGGGRCNITNAEFDSATLLANYGKASKFLHSAFSRFGVQDTIDYFESRGLPIKVEGRKRAFPATDSAEDVVQTLEDELERQSVTINRNDGVLGFEVENDQITSVKTARGPIKASRFILATGGRSRPETGSTGDGFKWLEDLGHTVNQPTPNITPLAVREKWVRDVSGVKISGANITFSVGGKKAFKVTGDLLFTHFGISGPTVLNSASKVAELLKQGDVTAKIDCQPSMTAAEFEAHIITVLTDNPGKQMPTLLKKLSPPGMSRVISQLIDPKVLEQNASELSKKQRQQFIELVKQLPLTIERLMGFEKAVVADGGVALEDVDTRSMASRKITNLYITGDLLNINRPTGGYSLQLCWTTGAIAGRQQHQ